MDVEEIHTLRERVERTRHIPRLAARRLAPAVLADVERYAGFYTQVYAAAASVSGASVLVGRRGRDVARPARPWLHGGLLAEVEALPPTRQIRSFDLRAGTNPRYPGGIPESGFRVVAPRSETTFQIESGSRCVLDIWGADSAFVRTSAKVQF